MSEADTDGRLLAAIKAGDRSALAALYDKHATQMFYLAFRILNNRRDAEDLLHDVFLEAWQKAEHYNPRRGSVRNWLLLRVRSRAIDRMRTLAVARQHAMTEHDREPILDSDATDRASDQGHACEALRSLPEVQRRVIELSYFEGLTYREIAERCGIPVGTAKSRLAAAVAKLREQFSVVPEVD